MFFFAFDPSAKKERKEKKKYYCYEKIEEEISDREEPLFLVMSIVMLCHVMTFVRMYSAVDEKYVFSETDYVFYTEMFSLSEI